MLYISKKLIIKYIKEKTKEIAKDYMCLGKEYKNAHIKLKFRCPKNHIFEMNWNNFNRGQRCPYCVGLKRKTLEEIKEYAYKFKCECLSNKYKNNKIKLEFRCSNNHIFKINWNNFKRGQGCPICYRENNHGENHPSWKNYTKEKLQELENYKANIQQLTNQNFRKYHFLVDPKRLRGKDHHLDHIYTVIDGFRNNVLPEIVASPINLQMLLAFDNISKHGRSDITKETLFELYNQFEKEIINL